MSTWLIFSRLPHSFVRLPNDHLIHFSLLARARAKWGNYLAYLRGINSKIENNIHPCYHTQFCVIGKLWTQHSHWPPRQCHWWISGTGWGQAQSPEALLTAPLPTLRSPRSGWPFAPCCSATFWPIPIISPPVLVHELHVWHLVEGLGKIEVQHIHTVTVPLIDQPCKFFPSRKLKGRSWLLWEDILFFQELFCILQMKLCVNFQDPRWSRSAPNWN